jgi:hypothetical protein
MKILPVGAELLHVDGQIHYDTNRAFRSFTEMAKNDIASQATKESVFKNWIYIAEVGR